MLYKQIFLSSKISLNNSFLGTFCLLVISWSLDGESEEPLPNAGQLEMRIKNSRIVKQLTGKV